MYLGVRYYVRPDADEPIVVPYFVGDRVIFVEFRTLDDSVTMSVSDAFLLDISDVETKRSVESIWEEYGKVFTVEFGINNSLITLNHTAHIDELLDANALEEVTSKLGNAMTRINIISLSQRISKFQQLQQERVREAYEMAQSKSTYGGSIH